MASGLLTPPEVTGAVLDLLALADVPDWVSLWAVAPPVIRVTVLENIASVGLNGLLPVFVFGPGAPTWEVGQEHRRRKIVAELLAFSG